MSKKQYEKPLEQTVQCNFCGTNSLIASGFHFDKLNFCGGRCLIKTLQEQKSRAEHWERLARNRATGLYEQDKCISQWAEDFAEEKKRADELEKAYKALDLDTQQTHEANNQLVQRAEKAEAEKDKYHIKWNEAEGEVSDFWLKIEELEAHCAREQRWRKEAQIKLEAVREYAHSLCYTEGKEELLEIIGDSAAGGPPELVAKSGLTHRASTERELRE